MRNTRGGTGVSNFKFNIGLKEFIIQDLGNGLNQEFVQLHEHFLIKRPFNYLKLEKAAHSYFDSHIGEWNAHDAFFNNFTIIWRLLLELGRFIEAENVWEFALAPAINWENAHPSQRLHKGTPYYFRGMTVILRGDLDRGFLLMHQALAEDIESSGNPFPNSPANAFATLDYQKQDQAFRNKVQETADFLNELLAEYRRTRGKVITLDEFQDRLFRIADLRDPVFLFVFALFKMRTLLKGARPSLRTNDFAGILETGLFFNLCLVIDSIIRYKNQQSLRFIDHLAFLSCTCQFNLNRDRLKQLNSAFGQDFVDFPKVANELLAGTFSFKDGLVLSSPEVDVALVYGLRNLAAHRVESLPIIYQKFEDISQRVMNVLFLAAEYLY